MAETAEASVLTVGQDSTSEFSDIQDAIDAARSGDTVIVEGGVYTGATIDKRLTVIGATDAVIASPGTPTNHRGFHGGRGGSGFYLSGRGADGTNLSGFTVAGDGSGFIFGVRADDVNSVVVQDMTITGVRHGILNVGGDGWIVRDNDISVSYHDGFKIGIWTVGRTVDGVVYPATDNVIDSNSVTGVVTRDDTGSGVVIFGVCLFSTSGGIVSANVVTGNRLAITEGKGKPRFTIPAGISLADYTLLVEGFHGVEGNFVVDNDLTGSFYAFDIDPPPADAIVDRNTVCDNTIDPEQALLWPGRGAMELPECD